MKVNLTEFDKAILLGMFIVTKGSLKKEISENDILLKFPTRQRKNARFSLKRLVAFKLLERKKNKFKLTKSGLIRAKKLIIEGAPIWGTYQKMKS